MPEPVSAPDLQKSPIQIRAAFSPRFNLAHVQNAVPVLLELTVVNNGGAALQNLTLELTASPALIRTRTWHIDSLPAGQHLMIEDRDVQLDSALLSSVSECLPVAVKLVLGIDGRPLVEFDRTIELLPRNHWVGIQHMPELTAAFVMPNDPHVDHVLKRMSAVLRKHNRDPALDGYQGGPRRAWELTSAAWNAVGSLELDYALPPASFEYSGQKIRTPGQIIDVGLATCLDSTLLMCAVLEQCGLNPVIVFTEGHALGGVWLRDETFASAVVDDVTALRKRVMLKELLLFESTLLSRLPLASLKTAAMKGWKQIAEGNRAEFELLVDIRRARIQRVKPLALNDDTAQIPVLEPVETIEPEFDDAPEVPVEPPAASPPLPADRLETWQRNLLDLSLRNNLLNCRAGKRVIPLDVPDTGLLEDRLAAGTTLRLKPRPQIMTGSDPRSRSIYESRTLEDPEQQLALEALTRNEVLVGIDEKTLDARLTELYRTARSALSEGGANTLFLALGFLVWNRETDTRKRFRAPLVLVPVTLNRKSMRAGFTLTLHDDEARFNPTLVQMLRQDFNLELPVFHGDLPKDEHGLDIDGIWHQVSNAIKEIGGWDVSQDVVLSTFSFAKYLMWKDLVDRTGHLRRNPVVQHLMDSPRDPYPSAVPFPDPAGLDRHDPQDTFCPLPADSSQLSAVMAAANGKDFVLIGPPGTGKSQTIANIIAQCLAEQKTVLFVAEKIAALDVVYRRLRDVGLGEFCLELHSSKARKLDVIQQLGRAWEASAKLDPDEWRQLGQKLKTVRDQLNEFVEHLHAEHRNGLTAWRAIGSILAGQEAIKLDLQWPDADLHNAGDLDYLYELTERLAVNAAEHARSGSSALQPIVHDSWSPGWQQALVHSAGQLGSATRALQQAAATFTDAMGLSLSGLDQPRREGLAGLADSLPLARGYDWHWILRSDIRRVMEDLRKGLALIRHYMNTFKKLSASYRGEVVQTDTEGLRERWHKAGKSFWPLRLLRRRAVRKVLEGYTEDSQRVDVPRDLEKIRILQDFEGEFMSLADLDGRTNGLWNGLKTSIDDAEKILAVQPRITEAIVALAGDGRNLNTVNTSIDKLLGPNNALLDATGPVTNAGHHYVAALAEFDRALADFVAHTGAEIPGFLNAVDDDPDQILHLCESLPSLQPRLRNWCAWHKVRNEAVQHGLTPLIEALQDGRLSAENLRSTFETNYCRWWLNRVVDHDAVLREFVSAEHEKRIADFCELDNRFTELARGVIRAALCAAMPAPDTVKRQSEWGVLRREMQKKRGHKPLRELISEIPEALTRLTPCLLMSPLSIAQYLSADMAPFDLVVFDEASQIPVWDAIGAIARGRQVVMVGDPRQLPPTSFFNRGLAAEDYELENDVETDLESILDECIGANLPTMEINWHYRSRHESLIAFSNHHYYQGKLVTFPSPVTDDRAVSLHYVADGVYEKGGARTNQPEARALVSEIVARLRDVPFQHSRLTIGVVTFNAEQQRLIEDLLDEARRCYPDIDRWFAEDALEPVFVKNLESVQGDERDIMYFSIGYGPDRDGRISMNFGPMNKDGGERRLNVAITRARHELRVFSSILADHLDLSRTQARGVRDLKHFLSYAERGKQVLAQSARAPAAGYDSPFEAAVAAALTSRGWQVHPQVGVSSFRINLGIVDPDAPTQYLAGVECDGTDYHRSATARDRDKLREQVLRGLGWELVRIWSTDWWLDSAGALNKLDSQLNALLEQKRAHPLPGSIPTDYHAIGATETDTEYGDADIDVAVDIDVEIDADIDHGFETAAPATCSASLDPDQFFSAGYDHTLQDLIISLVEAEDSIRDDDLARRIARAHGWSRTGRRIRERVNQVALQRYCPITDESGLFFQSDSPANI